MMKRFYTITLIGLLLCCRQQNDGKGGETPGDKNVSTTISTDTAVLAKLINLKIFKPTHAKFQYTFIDNSGGDERITVPGPSDRYLQAVLYFDEGTFKELKTKYAAITTASPDYKMQDFNFKWLDKAVREELLKSDTSYHGHTDAFFDAGYSGKLWLLNNKLLLVQSTD